MNLPFHALRVATWLALGGACLSAQATNGYFAHGYGTKAKGMGGAGLAVAQDAFAAANNPAQAMFAGKRLEGGLDLFFPSRDTSRSFNGAPLGTVESDKPRFLIPEFGYNNVLSNDWAVGLTVYGNGGMNTTYPGGTTDCTGFGGAPGSNALCGMGQLGVDLVQLVVAPTVAHQFSPGHSVGISPLLVHQQFAASGLQMFQMTPGASTDPTHLTNNGHDSSNGIGLRLGYMGKLSDTVSVGAAYSPKINMSRFKDYAGLFAGQGDFDIPENYGLGVAVQLAPSVQLLADYQHMSYSKVASVANPAGFNMGADQGGGFGWRDVEVVKLGVQWAMNPRATLRAGINRGTNPVTAAHITPNILAPGVMQTHFTLGGTYTLSPQSEMSWSFMYAPRVSVTGPSLFNGLLGSGTAVQETVRMRQLLIGFQYGMKF